MKKYGNLIAVLLILLSGGIFAACGHDHDNGSGAILYPYYTPTTYPGYSGDFLAWTSGDDSSLFFTLVRVNGRTGAVTKIGGFEFFPEMAYAPDGTLYGISDELHKIDPTNGSTVMVGRLDYGEEIRILMCGAAFSPGGVLYVVENSTPGRVFTVDLTTAALTYVGTPTALISDLEFAPNGILYGAFADLFVLNTATMGTVNKVGSTGTHLGSLTFDEGGRLFGMDIYPSTNMYALSLSTGAAAQVIPTGSSELVSFVVERPAASNKTVTMNGATATRSLETLLEREKKIKSARMMKMQ